MILPQPSRVRLPRGPIRHEPIPVIIPRLEPDRVHLDEPSERGRVVAVADVREARHIGELEALEEVGPSGGQGRADRQARP
jgi:hypothetical protein